MGLFSNMIMGKGNRPDYTPDMMPKNRWELFFEMLRLNFLNLLKLNLMYFVFWIPFWIWTWLNLEMLMQYDSMEAFVPGASVIRQEASFTFGNAMTSRMESACTICITIRSKP